jgi:phospholipase C
MTNPMASITTSPRSSAPTVLTAAGDGWARHPDDRDFSYAAAHTVSHAYSEHSSIIKFVNSLFDLTPLAELPDEASARAAGATNPAFNGPNGAQKDLGPADARTEMSDLAEAFDPERLSGKAEPLPASYALIDPSAAHTLPHYVSSTTGRPTTGRQVLGINPTDYPAGYAPGDENDPPPLDFNPRPTQSPGNPFMNTNNNTTGLSTGPWPN